jgi:hypothetical protein
MIQRSASGQLEQAIIDHPMQIVELSHRVFVFY